MQTLERKPEKNKQDSQTGEKSFVVYIGTAFFVAVFLFLGLNLALSQQSSAVKRSPAEVVQQSLQEQSQGIKARHSWSWWLTKFYEERSQAPDVVVFGSSLMGSVHSSVDAQFTMQLIDALTHRRMFYLEKQLSTRLGHKVSIFSLASPGEMISDAYAMSKSLFAGGKKPKLVIATIAPRDFIDSTLPFPAATDHYKFFSKYSDLSRLDASAYPEFFSRLGAELDRLPIKKLGRFSLSKNIESSKSDFDMSERACIEPGKALVPACAVPKAVDNSKEYIERFKNPLASNYKGEMQFFKAWLKELKADGIDVLVVCMPTTAANRQLLPEKFWQLFRSDIKTVCKNYGADLMDLSDSGLFTQADYLDTVHLNAYGGVRLFPVIAERVTMQKKFVQDLSESN